MCVFDPAWTMTLSRLVEVGKRVLRVAMGAPILPAQHTAQVLDGEAEL